MKQQAIQWVDLNGNRWHCSEHTPQVVSKGRRGNFQPMSCGMMRRWLRWVCSERISNEDIDSWLVCPPVLGPGEVFDEDALVAERTGDPELCRFLEDMVPLAIQLSAEDAGIFYDIPRTEAALCLIEEALRLPHGVRLSWEIQGVDATEPLGIRVRTLMESWPGLKNGALATLFRLGAFIIPAN